MVEIRRRSEYGFRHESLSYNWHRTWENLYTDFSWSVMSAGSREAVGTWLASPRCWAHMRRQVEDDASPALTSRRGKRRDGLWADSWAESVHWCFPLFLLLFSYFFIFCFAISCSELLSKTWICFAGF
jgi:hypothetical protein